MLRLPALLFVYLLAIPGAIFVGYMLSDPASYSSMLLVGGFVCVLAFPLFLRWHHLFAITLWNSSLVFPFLPGQPGMGLTVAAGSLLISVLNRTLNRRLKFISCPKVT